MPDTVTLTRPKSIPLTNQDRGWKVIAHNDDITPFDLVVMALQKAAGLSHEVAEMIAREIHESGSAVVKRGLDQEAAERICRRLVELTIIPGTCPGINVEAVLDDAA